MYSPEMNYVVVVGKGIVKCPFCKESRHRRHHFTGSILKKEILTLLI